jgi:hypothetical protein
MLGVANIRGNTAADRRPQAVPGEANAPCCMKASVVLVVRQPAATSP